MKLNLHASPFCSTYSTYFVVVCTLVPIVLLSFMSCSAKGDNPGYEYAPNMYHSVAYEGLSQITNKSQGEWVSSLDDGQGEYYNSNPYNPFDMNLGEPTKNTVKKNKYGILPYTVPKDSIEWAGEHVKNPLLQFPKKLSSFEKEGATLYQRLCSHCHGTKGNGDGNVAAKFAGIPKYNLPPYNAYKEGRIFHVISKGRGRMRSHASQISPEDRWKIVLHVQKLQKVN